MPDSLVWGSGSVSSAGCAFAGAIPPQHRASVMAAYYTVAYASISQSAVLAGLLVGPLGLEATFGGFGGAIALIAVSTAVVAWRLRLAGVK